MKRHCYKLNSTEITLLIIYALWSLYFFYFIYWKEYDNNAAGGMASMAMGFLCIAVLVVYVLGFSVGALLLKKRRRLYLIILPFLFMPLFIMVLIQVFIRII